LGDKIGLLFARCWRLLVIRNLATMKRLSRASAVSHPARTTLNDPAYGPAAALADHANPILKTNFFSSLEKM